MVVNELPPPLSTRNLCPSANLVSEDDAFRLLRAYIQRRDMLRKVYERNSRIPRGIAIDVDKLERLVYRFLSKLDSPLFQKLTDSELIQLLRRLEFMEVRSGTTLVSKEHPLQGEMILVLAGELELSADVKGRMTSILRLTMGQTVGEMSLIKSREEEAKFEDGTLRFTVRTVTDSIVCVITPNLLVMSFPIDEDIKIQNAGILNIFSTMKMFKSIPPHVMKNLVKHGRTARLAPGQELVGDIMCTGAAPVALAHPSVVIPLHGRIEIVGTILISAAGGQRRQSLLPPITSLNTKRRAGARATIVDVLGNIERAEEMKMDDGLQYADYVLLELPIHSVWGAIDILGSDNTFWKQVLAIAESFTHRSIQVSDVRMRARPSASASDRATVALFPSNIMEKMILTNNLTIDASMKEGRDFLDQCGEQFGKVCMKLVESQRRSEEVAARRRASGNGPVMRD